MINQVLCNITGLSAVNSNLFDPSPPPPKGRGTPYISLYCGAISTGWKVVVFTVIPIKCIVLAILSPKGYGSYDVWLHYYIKEMGWGFINQFPNITYSWYLCVVLSYTQYSIHKYHQVVSLVVLNNTKA